MLRRTICVYQVPPVFLHFVTHLYTRVVGSCHYIIWTYSEQKMAGKNLKDRKECGVAES